MTKNKVKQISYLSAITISVGSTIGAGIFFKNSAVFSNAGGSLGLAIASWVVSAIGILAIGLALVELASARTKDMGDGGIIGWVKKFTTRRIGKYAAAYMVLVYIPLTYLAMPLYAVQAIQDATGNTWLTSGWAIAGVALGFLAWMVIMGYFRLKVAEKMQWIFTVLKFIPLIIIPLMAIAQGAQNDSFTSQIDASAHSITGFSPWLGIMASIPSILFAFDGFYTVVSLQSKMKRPEKIGTVLSISISIVTAAYLFYAIFTGIVGITSPSKVALIADNRWLTAVINSLITASVLGIINGYSMSSPMVYRSISGEDRELGFAKVLQKRFKLSSLAHGAWLWSVLMALLYYVCIVPLGVEVWKDTSYVGTYGTTAGSLYELADLLTNFTSMVIFIFVGIAIIGGIHNRIRVRRIVLETHRFDQIIDSHQVQVNKRRYFIPAACIAIIFIFVGGIFFFANEFAAISGLNGASETTAIVKAAILGATLIIAALPQIFYAFLRRNDKSRNAILRED